MVNFLLNARLVCRIHMKNQCFYLETSMNHMENFLPNILLSDINLPNSNLKLMFLLTFSIKISINCDK